MTGPLQARTTRARGGLTLVLAAFLASLLLAWSHPLDRHGRPDHACDHTSSHVAPDGFRHDAMDCTLCALAHAPAMVVDLSFAPAPIAWVAAATFPRAALADSASVLSYSPRAPPT